MFASVFLATFLSSIVGATLFGISLNKLAIIPLEVYLIFTERKHQFAINNKQSILLTWYFLNIFACLAGMIFNNIIAIQFTGMFNSQLLWAIQIILFYIPLSFLLSNSDRKKEYKEYFLKSLNIVAKIQALWAIAQFLLYYILNYDLNSLVFERLFGGMLGGGLSWTLYSNLSGSGVLLRVSGLNRDAAFLGMIMLIGFIIEKNRYWRIVYCICTVLSFSRAGIIAIVVTAIYMFVTNRNIKINLSKVAKNILIYGLIIVFFVILYTRVEFIRNQVGRFIDRMNTISTGSDGTLRHLGYIPASLRVWLETPVLNKLFGVGLSCAGCLMSFYNSAISWLSLNSTMLSPTNAWSIECDPANMLLGTGIVGTITYYLFYLKVFLENKYNYQVRYLVVGILVFSIMYGVGGLTLLQLIFIGLFSAE